MKKRKRKHKRRRQGGSGFLLMMMLVILLGVGVLIVEKGIALDVEALLRRISFGKAEIVLDAGHGDHDPGAYIEEVAEKDIDLAVALKTKELLEEAGHKVALTRDKDSFLELEERASFANRKKAKVFVSIHCNSSEDGSGQGIETFYTDQKTEEDNVLAELIQSNVILETGAKDREVKTANYSVLVRTDMPAALVEVGFLTNDSERSLLMTEEYQDEIAEGIFKGIEAYFQE